MEHSNNFVKLKTQLTSSGCLSKLKLFKDSMKGRKKKTNNFFSDDAYSLDSEIFFCLFSFSSHISLPIPGLLQIASKSFATKTEKINSNISVALKQILSASFQFLQNIFLKDNVHFTQNNLNFQQKLVSHSFSLWIIAENCLVRK